MNKSQYNWLKAIIGLSVVILLLGGFLLGYVYNSYANKSCIENPFTYGIRETNKLNNDSFYCTCFSDSGNINPFWFDADEIKERDLSDRIQLISE